MCFYWKSKFLVDGYFNIENIATQFMSQGYSGFSEVILNIALRILLKVITLLKVWKLMASNVSEKL
jgi:hypothetical protein